MGKEEEKRACGRDEEIFGRLRWVRYCDTSPQVDKPVVNAWKDIGGLESSRQGVVPGGPLGELSEHVDQCSDYALMVGLSTSPKAKERARSTRRASAGGQQGCNVDSERDGNVETKDFQKRNSRGSRMFGVVPAQRLQGTSCKVQLPKAPWLHTHCAELD